MNTKLKGVMLAVISLGAYMVGANGAAIILMVIALVLITGSKRKYGIVYHLCMSYTNQVESDITVAYITNEMNQRKRGVKTTGSLAKLDDAELYGLAERLNIIK